MPLRSAPERRRGSDLPGIVIPSRPSSKTLPYIKPYLSSLDPPKTLLQNPPQPQPHPNRSRRLPPPFVATATNATPPTPRAPAGASRPPRASCSFLPPPTSAFTTTRTPLLRRIRPTCPPSSPTTGAAAPPSSEPSPSSPFVAVVANYWSAKFAITSR
nr:proline-rich receptor-like protein kinase PERK8 [Aegilops tauschii subsp. strangulata]